jgi:thioredoxin 1
MGPAVEALANEYAGRAKVGKLNVDDNVSLAGRYNIRGVPTLLLFKDGQIRDQLVGACPKDHIKKMLDKHL